MSKKRKTPSRNPTRRPPARPAPAPPAAPSTPEGLLSGLTHSTAERVLEGLRVLVNFGKDFPDTPHLAETVTAYKVAALALIEALDAQHGRTPYRLQEAST